jgi:hypothetical protein
VVGRLTINNKLSKFCPDIWLILVVKSSVAALYAWLKVSEV